VELLEFFGDGLGDGEYGAGTIDPDSTAHPSRIVATAARSQENPRNTQAAYYFRHGS
jgi:hypothetical protein